ncbi:MAG: hypothetical protein EU541_01400 [Promethearchaeota archaeon]|nr:MAG: hypothetical protein EU541_01400 [Candidatus Lokiarchaeota archaeon]
MIKKNVKKTKILAIISILLIVNSIHVLQYLIEQKGDIIPETKKTQNITSAYYNTSAAPIYIDGGAYGVGAHNWTWAKDQPWCSGSGIWGDPFIISNLTINGMNSDSCIKIVDSTVFFQIKNCTLFNSSSGSFPSYKAGIELYRVENGFIKNCTIYDNNGYGISLWNCDNNTMTNNKIINDDIWFQSSEYNSIVNNTFLDTSDAVWVESGSHHNKIAENEFNNAGDAIYISTDNNKILNNTFENCEGVLLGVDADNNTVFNNTVDNCECGISFQSGNYNEIKYNTIMNASAECYIIRLFEGSKFNNVSYNIILNNSADGILVRNSNNNTLFNNTIKFNSKYGINLDASNFTTVLNNILIKNVEGCIREYDCFGSMINNNICVELPSGGNGGEELIFGYNLFLFLGIISIISLILIMRVKKNPN